MALRVLLALRVMPGRLQLVLPRAESVGVQVRPLSSETSTVSPAPSAALSVPLRV